MKNNKKGRIYIRCSTKEQSDKESLKYQEDEYKKYINKRPGIGMYEIIMFFKGFFR